MFHPFIDDGRGERCGQHRHLATEIGTAGKRFGLLAAGRYEPRNRPATISNRHLVTLSHLVDQRGEILPGFTYACFLHHHIVLHVAQNRNQSRSRNSTGVKDNHWPFEIQRSYPFGEHVELAPQHGE